MWLRAEKEMWENTHQNVNCSVGITVLLELVLFGFYLFGFIFLLI